LKIDVEGAELMLLSGARKIIETYRPKIILSTHGDDVHQQCVQWLKILGYHLESIPSTKSIDETRAILAVYK